MSNLTAIVENGLKYYNSCIVLEQKNILLREEREKMGKIIKIANEIVYIGMKDGSLKEIPLDKLGFTPRLNMQVEVYESDTETLVVAKPVFKAGEGRGVLVNKLVYILLAVFLGGFGIHKFYAKRTLSGIFYFLFCWTGIPAIIGLIEAILAISKKADANGNIIL